MKFYKTTTAAAFTAFMVSQKNALWTKNYLLKAVWRGSEQLLNPHKGKKKV